MTAMTETDAKTKWCPFARVVVDSAGYSSGNRFPGTSRSAVTLAADTHCIGASCMVWRGEGKLHSDSCSINAETCDCPKLGFCGLVGKP